MFEPTLFHATHLLVATAWGGMLFFGAVVAPLIFTKLPAETSGPFIRQVFPVYYLVLAIVCGVGALLLVTLSLAGPRDWWLDVALLLASAVGFVYARQSLMPKINRLRDAATASGDPADHRRWNLHHRASTWINAAQIIAVLVVLIRLAR